MATRVLVLAAMLLILSDARITRLIDYSVLFGNGTTMALEQAEAGKTGKNLLNCGDYSGCTLVQVADEAGVQGEGGNEEAMLRYAGIAGAVVHVRKRVSASASRL